MELKIEAAPESPEQVRRVAPKPLDETAGTCDVDCGAMSGDAFGDLTVGQIIGRGAIGCKLRLHYDLGDAASALAASGRTAAVVADSEGGLVGLLTENDVMRAYFEGALPSNHLGDWFDSGMARGSDFLVRKLIVRPCTPLSEVAERIVANLVSGDCACHHVVVEEDDGQLFGVLSSLDMVQALCHPEVWNGRPMGAPPSPLAEAATKMTVKDIMKPQDDVFTCPPSSTMKEVCKVLLMTQQNSALIVDAQGIYGIVTPRDAVRAFAEGIESSVSIAEWLQTLQPSAGPRLVESETCLADAAVLMTTHGLHHLVVVAPETAEAIGTLSSLDLALCTKARTSSSRPSPQWGGPTVGELVTQEWHLTAVCNKGATLREAATILASSGRTSTALALADETSSPRLLTEHDIMRAFVDGWAPDATAESWLLTKPNPETSIPQHVVVPRSVRLVEAAWLMLSAPKPGVDPCHHLVVKCTKGTGGGWLGVFSALDIARGLAGIDSELEAAKTGADQTRVSVVMKTLESVPTCKPEDTLQHAMGRMISARQSAIMVMRSDGQFDLITPRSALQALAAGIPPDCVVGEFVSSRAFMSYSGADEGPREIGPELSLLEAAAIMTQSSMHHLIVKDPKTSRLVGILSSLDLVRAVASIRSKRPFASLGWLWACTGPTVCTVW
mmetsp:Transcript_40824/g.117271  ORF Transcript_40824/g.117271 Transcript_40824/m.117271 type:complete len:671 (-) Transcript_40824:163-2175(-)